MRESVGLQREWALNWAPNARQLREMPPDIPPDIGISKCRDWKLLAAGLPGELKIGRVQSVDLGRERCLLRVVVDDVVCHCESLRP